MKKNYLIKKSPIVLIVASKQNLNVIDLPLSKEPNITSFLGLPKYQKNEETKHV